MVKSLIPTKENPHPLLSLKGKERNRFAIRSLLFTIIFTAVVYLIPSYYHLETITTQTSNFVLHVFGYNPRLYVFEDSFTKLNSFDQFMFQLYDSNRATYPAISIDTHTLRRQNYLIVRACTGMQAGALLVGLVWATPAKLDKRIRSSYAVLLSLFIGNALRIAAMIAMTTIMMENFGLDYDTAWHYCHDWLGRPIGFFGTIAFTAVIESKDVRILDTISVWMDALQDFLNYLYNLVFGK